MIIARTPVRISFFGGGTDYREYYLRHGGAVLGTTINKYVYVSLNRLSQFFEYKIRVGYSKSELVNRVEDIIHPSVRECLKFKNVDGFLDVHIFSDLPAKTGLGSSSAFTCGFLQALHMLGGKTVSKEQLAEETRYVEQEMIKENVGSQDQYHAAFGGLNIIEFNKSPSPLEGEGRGEGESSISVRPVIISQEKRELLDNSMMVFYTGINRFASDIVKEQVDNTRAGNKDDYLRAMYNMVFDAEKIIANASPTDMVRELGEMMHESWELKKRLSSKVTNDTIDDMYLRARGAGAYGGKISGAGGGGFLTLLVPREKQVDVHKALEGLLQVDCAFENHGSKIIYCE